MPFKKRPVWIVPNQNCCSVAVTNRIMSFLKKQNSTSRSMGATIGITFSEAGKKDVKTKKKMSGYVFFYLFFMKITI